MNTFRVNLPQQSLYFLFNFPFPVNAEGENKGEHQEAPQDSSNNFSHPLSTLTFLLLISTKRLVEGLEALWPVDSLVEGVLGELFVHASGQVSAPVIRVATKILQRFWGRAADTVFMIL